MDFVLTPTAVRDAKSRARLQSLVVTLAALPRAEGGTPEETEAEAARIVFNARLSELPSVDQVRVEAAGNLLIDLAKSGWTLRISGNETLGTRPELEGDVRTTRRAQLANRRLEQLREPAVREFVARMESGHPFAGRMISVFDLMRDGRDLARGLTDALAASDPESALQACVKPYLQFIETGAKCPHSGFLLQDIWRYFRHTWSSAYESIPGRSIQFLVRDGAAPFHPVMGIASIASAASVQPARDEQIGWTREALLREAREKPSTELADWVVETIEAALEGIYRQDLVEEKVLPARLPALIESDVIATLVKAGEVAKERHVKQSSRLEHKSSDSEPVDEEGLARLARTDLYRWKRTSDLAAILEIRNVVNAAYEGHRGKSRLEALLANSAGRKAFEKLVRRARSISVGTAIADLNVCGAIAPYNEILAGKLVAMLAVSPQTVFEYRRRYHGKASWIASRMAGRAVVRSANLVFVGTTSLYGTRPSQYDRAGFPASLVGGKDGYWVRYRYLSDTAGVGTAQFSAATKSALQKLLARESNQSENIKFIFGEGANPKLRLLREGIVALGIRGPTTGGQGADSLLTHGMRKAAYGVWLVDNLRDYLLGFAARPCYAFKLDDVRTSTERIGSWWISRWVRKRLEKPEALQRVAAETLVRPVRHRARVTLPEADAAQLRLLY